MESVWSVSKLSTESVGSRRECVHTAYADATKQFRRDETRQFRLVGVGGVYWALIRSLLLMSGVCCGVLLDLLDLTSPGDQRQQQRRSVRQLHDAVSRHDVTLVRQLTTPTSGSGRLDYDVDQCLRGVTALQAAAQRGSVDLCRCLLAAGADPDRFDPVSGDTALHAAARAGHVDVVRVLLDAPADAEVTDSSGSTALAVAAQVCFTPTSGVKVKKVKERIAVSGIPSHS